MFPICLPVYLGVAGLGRVVLRAVESTTNNKTIDFLCRTVVGVAAKHFLPWSATALSWSALFAYILSRRWPSMILRTAARPHD